MKKRFLYGGLIVLLAAVEIMGARIYYFRSAHAAEKDSAYPSLELFSYVLEKVRKDYVDGKKADLPGTRLRRLEGYDQHAGPTQRVHGTRRIR